MAQLTNGRLGAKALFEAGDRPTDQDFADLFDSVLFLGETNLNNNGPTSIFNNFTIDGTLTSTGVFIVDNLVMFGKGLNEQNTDKPLQVYSLDTDPTYAGAVIFASSSQSDILFEGISGDATSSIKLTDSVATVRYGTHTNKGFLEIHGEEIITYSTGSSDGVIYMSGSLGINVPTPGRKLSIAGDGINIDNGSANAVLELYSSNDWRLQGGGAFVIHDVTANKTPFTIEAGAGTNTLVVDSNSRVGIGTNSPSVSLHIKSAGDEILRLDHTSTAGSPYMTWQQNGTRRALMQFLDTNNELRISNEYGPILFRTDTNASEVTRMYISDAGKVGIGTTNPGEKLEVIGNISASGWISASGLAIAGSNVGISNGDVYGSNTGSFAYITGSTIVGTHVGDGSALTNITGNNIVGLIDNDENNRITTALGTGAGVNAEANLKFDGTNLMVSGGANHAIKVIAPNAGEALLELRGISSGQGTGRLFIGQSTSHGGGLLYDGDGTPSFAGSTGNDRISFYRTSSNVHHPVFSYYHDSDNVKFEGKIGVGTGSPAALIHLDGGPLGLSELLRLQAKDDTGDVFMTFYDNTGNRKGYIGYGASSDDHLRINQEKDAHTIFGTDNLERMRITDGGVVAIGTTTTTAATKLMVSTGGTQPANIAGNVASFQQAAQSNYAASIAVIAGNAGSSTIYFGDTNAMGAGGVRYHNNTNYMGFKTNGTHDRMVINSSGNVGIGLTGPTEKLEVVGAIKIPKAGTTDNVSPGLILVSDDDFTYTGTAGSSQYINNYGFGFHNPLGANPAAGSGAYISGYFGVDIFTAGQNRLHVAQNGKIGIGTEAPSAPLHIHQSGTDDGTAVEILRLSRLTSTDLDQATPRGEAYMGLWSGDDNNDKEVARISWAHDNAANGEDDGLINFYTRRDNTLTKAVTINHDGNVGIGNSTPVVPLHIKDSQGELIRLEDTSSTGSPYISFYRPDPTTPARRGFIQYNNSYDGFRYYTDDGGTHTFSTNQINRLRIQSDGKVGIGTTSPTEKLHVAGNTKSMGSIRFDDVSRYWLSTGGSNNWGLYWDTTNNFWEFRGGGVNRFRIEGGTGHVKATKYESISGNTLIGNDAGGYINIATNSATYGMLIRANSATQGTSWGHAWVENDRFQLHYGSHSPDNGFNINSTGHVGIGGAADTTHSLRVYGASGIYCDQWMRTGGSHGLFFQTHGGGWHMTDSNWIRSYNNKAVYIQNNLRTDGTFQVGDSGNRFAVDASYTRAAQLILCKGGSTNASHQIRLYNGANDSRYFSLGVRTDFSPTWLGAATGEQFVFYGSDGGSKGYIRSNVNVAEIDFTGQHMSIPETDVFDYIDKVGYIVISNGTYQNIPSESEPNKDLNSPHIDESLPIIKLSDKENDKRVFGVVSAIESPVSETHEYQQGAFTTVIPKDENDNRLVINSLGEGAVWVSNLNGNLENGDYITTSEIHGLGMKQDDDLLHNYTVAKITQDCDFENDDINIIVPFHHNGLPYKRAFVGCTYHCG